MIIVTSLRDSHAQLAAHGAKRAISILSPDTPHPDFPALADGQHLRLTFHDVNADGGGLEGPKMRDAERLVHFITEWDRTAPLLIHCWAGIVLRPRPIPPPACCAPMKMKMTSPASCVRLRPLPRRTA